MNLDKIKEHLSYNPLTGLFNRLQSHRNVKIGDIAGSVDASKGYVKICVLGKYFKAHQLAFLFMKGYIPKEIDHINHDKTDNKWDNLREVTHAENLKNYTRQPSSLPQGISKIHDSRFRVRIHVNGKPKHLGYYQTIEKASSKYEEAKAKYGFHKNHGIRGII